MNTYNNIEMAIWVFSESGDHEMKNGVGLSFILYFSNLTQSKTWHTLYIYKSKYLLWCKQKTACRTHLFSSIGTTLRRFWKALFTASTLLRSLAFRLCTT